MKLHIVSVIPLELYVNIRRKFIEEKLLLSRSIHPTDNKIKFLFSEISGGNSSMYDISPSLIENAMIVFYESSLCICINKEIDNWVLESESITNELKKRNDNHTSIININDGNPLQNFLKEIQELPDEEEYGKVFPSYVFSFYIIERNKSETVDKSEIMKLVEPSIIDMDDMLSTEYDTLNDQTNIKQSAIDSIIDADISNTSETYISWAAIVSICEEGEAAQKSKNLLTALELRLQMIWNKCHSVSNYINKVFDKKHRLKILMDYSGAFQGRLMTLNRYCHPPFHHARKDCLSR